VPRKNLATLFPFPTLLLKNSKNPFFGGKVLFRAGGNLFKAEPEAAMKIRYQRPDELRPVPKKIELRRSSKSSSAVRPRLACFRKM
jgi:hypothetical protein